eukprot:5170659-Amphidinium_carterae.1
MNAVRTLVTKGAATLADGGVASVASNYILIRCYIGPVGATFVTNQFRCSLMFAPNIIGTANAAAAD